MRRLLRLAWALLSSRVTSPIVIGLFLLAYIGIAFFTDDALMALMELIRRSVVLVPLLALLPLSSFARIVMETRMFLQRRRAVSGNTVDAAPALFNETVELAVSPVFDELREKLEAQGYRTRQTERSLSAWRGIGLFPARLLFLTGTFCIFSGILISLTTRTSYRGPVIEGELFPAPAGSSGVVERIRLEKPKGRILSRNLILEVAPSRRGAARTSFGIYPPGIFQGSFVYPRYLGVALLVRFSAPDRQKGYEAHEFLNIYPPGKEAAVEIPDTPYRLMLSMANPDDGSDPFETGRMEFVFKLLKDKDVILSGSMPGGGEFSRNGYYLAFPDFRRMVITDFIRDYGVLLIWTSAILLGAALLYWLPVRLFFPRREMLFLRQEEDMIKACSRAEGRGRWHGGIFNEVLDHLEASGERKTAS